jgi:hypothetical protein
MGFLDRLLGRTKEAGEDVMGEAEKADDDAKAGAEDVMGGTEKAAEGMKDEAGHLVDEAKKRTDM